MKLDKKLMLKLMKEEYDKRVKYYLGEIETRDKDRDVNLVKDAKGLKVRNKQGLELTIEDFVVIDNIEYIVLRPPEMERAGVEEDQDDINVVDQMKTNDSYEVQESLTEAEDEEKTNNLDRDLRAKSKKMDYKRSFKDYDADYDSLNKSDVRDGFVYVKITDFESEYSL
mgnify:CR=1 FL=1